MACGRSEPLDFQLPGDTTGDSQIDLSDAVAILGFLFMRSPQTLPCGDGGPGDRGSLALVDWQGDGRIDISDVVAAVSFLFLGGRGHTLAAPRAEMTTCVRIAGCPEGCGN